jgi:hypothetical protein
MGIKDAAQGGMPGFVAGAILGLFGLNLLVLRESQDGD